jgi:hypothetical protein
MQEQFAVSSMQQAVGSKQQKLEQLPVWTPDRSDFAFYNSSAGFLINDLPPVWSPPDRPNIYRGLMPAHYRAAPGNIQRSQSVKPEGGFAYWRTGFLLLSPKGVPYGIGQTTTKVVPCGKSKVK